jgi:tRNA(Phe) wybutosine-synthesizing methylase Tyw3
MIMATNKKSLNQQAEEIIKIAEEAGVQTNFFFLTTFKRYQVQINILSELEKKIKEEGTLVTKEYVKGRGNLYCNPAVSEYNRTTDSANKTVSTLIKIIKGFKGEDNSSDVDPLLAIINGGDEDEE